MPGLQLKHALDPALAEYVSTGHSSQTMLLNAPGSVENFPGAQLMQPSGVPGMFAYVPGTQAMQTVLLGAGDSPSQHFEQAVAPENATICPDGHGLQDGCPLASEYVPALHTVHAELPAPAE